MAMIKKLGMLLTPLVFAGFILPDDSCHNASPVSKQVDGPYVLYHNDQVIIHSIVEEDKLPSLHTDSTNISNKENVLLKVSTDQAGQFFDVHLQKNLEPQQSEYAQPSKMFILSDIEGNFAGFRKLLQAGSVIDS